MSHEIYSMAYTGQTPWHGLGEELDPNASIDVWAEKGGFNWTVEESQLFYNASGKPAIVKGKKVFYRSDHPEIVLGVATNQFNPVQPRAVLEFYEEFNAETEFRLHTAGILKQGERFWALAKNNSTYAVGGTDVHENHLLVATANDGSMATRILPTDVRVVCANTARMALSDQNKGLSINHRSVVNWDRVRQWVRGETELFALWGNLYDALSNVPINVEQAAQFAKDLIAPDWTPGKEKMPRKLQAFADTMQQGVGQSEAGETAYGLFNSVTRYVDHDAQARSQETRLNSAFFGTGAHLKTAAMDMLVKQCSEKWGQPEVEHAYAEIREAA